MVCWKECMLISIFVTEYAWISHCHSFLVMIVDSSLMPFFIHLSLSLPLALSLSFCLSYYITWGKKEFLNIPLFSFYLLFSVISLSCFCSQLFLYHIVQLVSFSAEWEPVSNLAALPFLLSSCFFLFNFLLSYYVNFFSHHLFFPFSKSSTCSCRPCMSLEGLESPGCTYHPDNRLCVTA